MDNFLKKDNANNGLMTKVWGPPGWMFLHSITLGYPIKIDNYDEEHIIRKNKMKIFFESIGHVFPCKYCRISYLKFIKEIPIDKFLNSRKDLALWLYKIHNKVNHKLGVPKCNIPTFENMYKEYDTYRAECSITTSTERIKNLNKGCVVPRDGLKRKCIVKVIKINNIDYYKYIFITILLIPLILYLLK